MSFIKEQSRMLFNVFRRTEEPSLLRLDDNGQRDTYVSSNMPFVCIRQVVKHNLWYIDCLFLVLGIDVHRQQYDCQNEQY